MKLNVAEKAVEVMERLTQDGFKGYYPNYQKKEMTWHEEYAIFIMEFNTPDFSFDITPDCEYCTPPEFNEFAFRNDFDRFLKKEFPNCEIRSNHNINEFEIIGPNNSEFYKTHMDKLEEIASKVDVWSIYEPV